MPDPRPLLEPIRALHDRIRAAVVDACERQSAESLASVDAEEVSDTIYTIDRVSEHSLIQGFEEIARDESICLLAEGLPGGLVTLPHGTPERNCRWRVLVDPIDGTRPLMYQKRSAWILTGVAPNRGAATCLRDIELAVQTEIPILKQHLSDQWWAVRGDGAHGERYDRISGTRRPLTIHPSGAPTLGHGFASVTRNFPGVRDVLASIDDEIALTTLGPPQPGKAALFEDQYQSTGGQLYELMSGHDRFIADIRPLADRMLIDRGLPRGLYCHPYDLSSSLVAEELGVILRSPTGGPLDAPLDLETDCAWVGYANDALRATVEPALIAALKKRGMI